MPKTKEEKAKYMREYRKNNPEYLDKQRKSVYICKWKKRGVIDEDYNKLYEYYLSIEECDNCGVELNQDGATRKCLDHDHKSGLFRNILCNVCNVTREYKKRDSLGRFT